MKCPSSNCVKRGCHSKYRRQEDSSSDPQIPTFPGASAGSLDSKGEPNWDLEWDAYCQSPVEDFAPDDVSPNWDGLSPNRKSVEQIMQGSIDEVEHLVTDLKRSCNQRCTYGCVHTLFTRVEKLVSFLGELKSSSGGFPKEICQRLTKNSAELQDLKKKFDLMNMRKRHRKKQVEMGVSQQILRKHFDFLENMSGVEFPKDLPISWDSLEILSQQHLENVQDLTEVHFITESIIVCQEERTDCNSTNFLDLPKSAKTATLALKNFQTAIEGKLLEQFWLLGRSKCKNGVAVSTNRTQCLLGYFNFAPEHIILEVSEIQRRHNLFTENETQSRDPNPSEAISSHHQSQLLPSQIRVSIEVSIQNIQNTFIILEHLEREMNLECVNAFPSSSSSKKRKQERSFGHSVCYMFLVLLAASFLYIFFYICLYIFYLQCQSCFQVKVSGETPVF